MKSEPHVGLPARHEPPEAAVPVHATSGANLPPLFTTSEILGRAMLRVAQGRADRFILESTDINKLGR